MLVEEIWTQYYDYVRHKPSGKVRFYYWIHLKKYFGFRQHEDVTEKLCRAYVAQRMKAVSVSTAWGELSCLRTALNFAVRKRLIPRDSYEVWLPTPNGPKELRLTREQFHLLLSEAKSDHIRLFILLLISTACRMTAALELTWDRVDFDSGLINLRTSGDSTRKGRAVVPMTDSLRKALLEAKDKAKTRYVLEYAGQRLHKPYDAFKRAAVRAGVPWCSPHVLRHTAATWMAEGGVKMSEIARVLGHSDSIITERVYAKYSPEYLKNAVSSLEV